MKLKLLTARSLLALLCSQLALANTCVDAASGIFNSAASWSSCGGTYPHDGDTATIENGFTITLTSDAGTNSQGLAGIVIGVEGTSMNNNSSLITDGAGHHTIYLNSTGSTCGSNMVGILVNKGSLDFSSATPTNYITIESPSGTNPVYIAHTQYSSASDTSTIKLNNIVITNLGVNTSPCYGIFSGTDSGYEIFSVQNSIFNGGCAQMNIGSYTNTGAFPLLNNVTWIGRTCGGYFQASTQTGSTSPAVITWSISNITDYLPLSSSFWFSSNYTPDALVMTAPAMYLQASGSGSTGGLIQATSSTSTTRTFTISYPIVDYNSTQSNVNTSIAFEIAPGSTANGTIQYAMVYNAYEAGAAQAGSSTMNWLNNWFTSNNNTGTGQGQIIIPHSVNVVTGNMITWDNVSSISTNANTGLFCYSAGSPVPTCTFNHSSVYYPANPGIGGSSALAMGDGGATGPTTPLIINSLAVNPSGGISDGSTNAVWSTAGTGGVGSSNNDIYNASTSAYYSQGGSTNFGTGHPNPAYGDVTINPVLVAPNRRIASFDAQLGGPGTEAHFFQEMAARSGLTSTTGLAGGLTYNSAYTPQALYQYLSAGFAPLNASLGNLASDGTYIGAVSPVLIGAW